MNKEIQCQWLWTANKEVNNQEWMNLIWVAIKDRIKDLEKSFKSLNNRNTG